MRSAGGEVSPTFNVLISSAGRSVELVEIFRRTLQGLRLNGRVIATESTAEAAALYAADRGIATPHLGSARYLARIKEICAEQRVDLIVPNSPEELALFAAHREAFEELGVAVAVSSPQVVAITQDKTHTQEWLQSKGFLGAPVRPLEGAKSYSVDFFAGRDGQCRCAISTMQVELAGGEVTKGVTLRHEAMEDLVFALCEALPGAYGALHAEILADEQSGALYVRSIDARFGEGFPLAWQAGGDYPRWLIEELLGLSSTASHEGWQERLIMLRYHRAIYLDQELLHDGPSITTSRNSPLPLPPQR